MKERYLVIDDHDDVRELMCRLLEAHGYQTHGAATREDALYGVQTFAPHVILLEWAFRREDGLGLAAALRERAAEFGLEPIVILLSFMDEPEGLVAQERADAYSIKPVDINAILRLVDSCWRYRPN